MKVKLIGAALVLLTAATVGLYPYLEGVAKIQPVDPSPATTAAAQKIEVVFVLDTTSSMSGLIATAKEKIWSIATTLAQAEQAPDIEMGIVAYRDRGDAYVTRVIDLSSDLDTMYGHLMQFEAVGGGDGPESVNAALDDAVRKISWSQDPSSYQVIFLVGDAPPHMDYQDDTAYPEVLRVAAAKGIVVNTIQCGAVAETTRVWSEIARLGNGRYLQVGQSGDAFALATPYDAEIASLSAQLDGTRLFYGNTEEMHWLNSKVAATGRLTAEASAATRARRAAFNATAAGSKNLFGDQDLVANVTSGAVALEAVPEAELPASLRELDRSAQTSLIESLAAQREDLTAQIDALTASRADYLRERAAEDDSAASSLDRQFYDTVRDQAAAKGLRFESGPEF